MTSQRRNLLQQVLGQPLLLDDLLEFGVLLREKWAVLKQRCRPLGFCTAFALVVLKVSCKPADPKVALRGLESFGKLYRALSC